jgi:ankyrin repeat protein
MRQAIWLLLGAALLATTPAGAQMYSEGYQFLEAVRKRDGDKVNELLDKPGTTIVNARDISTGETGLHIAAARRDLTWLQFLINKGANPNIADKDGVTPLIVASQRGFIEGVQALAKAGARIDVANNAGETPLISAVHNRDIPMMRALLLAGANPDKADNSGRTARDHAKAAVGGSTLLDEIERSAKKTAGGDKPKYGPS